MHNLLLHVALFHGRPLEVIRTVLEANPAAAGPGEVTTCDFRAAWHSLSALPGSSCISHTLLGGDGFGVASKFFELV